MTASTHLEAQGLGGFGRPHQGPFQHHEGAFGALWEPFRRHQGPFRRHQGAFGAISTSSGRRFDVIRAPLEPYVSHFDVEMPKMAHVMAIRGGLMGPKSENVEKALILPLLFEGSRGP